MFSGHADHFPPSTEHATEHSQAAQEPSEVESSQQPAPQTAEAVLRKIFSAQRNIAKKVAH